MSLMSLISGSTGSSASAASLYGNTAAAGIQKTIDAANAAKTTTSAGSPSSGGATISTAAKIAAAEALDNKKDFSTLSSDVRTELDAQYKASGMDQPDLSEMSGRALAAISLNTSGAFSRSEMLSAQTELKGRARQDFLNGTGSGTGLAGLASYSQQVVSQYDAMSQEERDALGWKPATRANAQTFVDTVNGTGGHQSLFNLLSGTED
jgi:hypothetical protein